MFHQGDFFIDEGEDHTIEWIIPNAQKMRWTHFVDDKSAKEIANDKSHEGEEFGYVLKGKIDLLWAKSAIRSKLRKHSIFQEGIHTICTIHPIHQLRYYGFQHHQDFRR